MTYVAADKYLVDHGKLGFVITKSLFQSELGGWHFRAFKLPDGVPLGLTIVDDFERVKPFKGQAANNTVTMLLEKGKVTEYPIPWKAHRPKQRRQQIAEDATREEAIAAITTRDWTARPVDTSDHQSALISGEPAIVDILVPLLGSSPYGPLAREGINTRGANGVYFLDAAEVHGRLLVVNRADDGDDRSLPARQQTLESELVYPLIKGADVHRWLASPSAYVLLPHVASAPNSPVAFAQLPAKTQEFLSAFRRKLESRTSFRNFDPSGSEWYGLYSVLTATFSPVKVVWREQARGSIAAVVEGAAVPTSSHKLIVPDNKLLIIPLESVDEANFVCAMLNSSISAYLIRSYALSTGISTHILERLPIPRYQRRIPAHEKIAQFGRQIASLARTATPDQIAEAEHELDVAVGKLFGLSKHDVNLVRIALADLDQ